MTLLADPFQTLTADIRERFRPQREWSQRRGLLLILAHFLTGTGAGGWLFSLFLSHGAGLWVSLGLVATGAVAHLLFLGRPERFWRMARRVRSSWISLGFVGMQVFVLGALVLLLVGGLEAEEGFSTFLLRGLTVLGAGWIVVYKGFVWGSSKGIPLWHTPLVPILYMAYGLRAGAALLLLLAALDGGSQVTALEVMKLWLAVSTAVLVLIYLGMMRGSGVTALRSVELLLFGRVALPFYLGAVLLGLVIPILIGGLALFDGVPAGLLGLIALLSLLGDLAIIYCIARAGLYRPLPA